MAAKPAYDDSDLLYIGEAAEFVGHHPDTLRRWADAGRLPSVRTPGNQRRFKVADLRALVDPTSDPSSEAGGGDGRAA